MKKWTELKPLQSLRPLIKDSKASQLLQPYQPQLQQLPSYDGVSIPLTVLGRPDAKPVLLLHAFGMDARQFLPFVLPLASEFCFYLPHFRGFGLAAATPSSEFDFIEQYASDVEQLLSHICATHAVASVDVAAISMGALVVWAYFNRHKDSPETSKIGRYLNIDQSPIVKNQPDWRGGVFGEKQDELFAKFATVLQQTLPYINQPQASEQQQTNDEQPASYEQKLDKQNPTAAQKPNDFTQLPLAIRKQFVELETAFSLMSVQRLPSRMLVNSMGYIPDRKLASYHHPTWQQKLRGLQAYLQLPYDYRQALPNTQSPVTMLVGGQSQLYDPKWQYRVAEILPNAQLVQIAESGHAIPLDAPLQFARALKQFLVAS